jgi:hypothetical protein
MTNIPAEVPGPAAGQPGHFAHHDWLTAAVKALDAALMPTAAGVVNATIAIGQLSSPAVAVTFPVGRFDAAPIVVATASSAASGAFATVGGSSLSGVNVYLHARAAIAGNAFTTGIHWHARKSG